MYLLTSNCGETIFGIPYFFLSKATLFNLQQFTYISNFINITI